MGPTGWRAPQRPSLQTKVREDLLDDRQFGVVCGQAQRSTSWLANGGRRTDLFTHLLSRNDQRVQRGAPTRFERGTEELLLQVREMSRRSDVKLKVYVV